MVSGKGGVGKTSLSAALAVKYAAAGHDTLIVSTDPAHSLGDSLGQLLPGGVPVPVEGTDLPIWGMEIDPDKVTENFKAFASTGGKAKVQGVLDKFGVGKLMEQLDELGLDELLSTPPPGLDEAIAIAKVVEFVEGADYARFSRIIFDTAPTGHTLRMLSLPDFVSSTLVKVRTLQSKLKGANRAVTALFGEGGSEKAVERLQALQARVDMVAALFRDQQNMDFVIATIPTTMALEESARLLASLQKEGVPASTIIVNQVITEGMGEPYLKMKLQEQRAAMRMLADSPRLKELDVIKGQYTDLEVTGVPALQYFASDLWRGMPAPASAAGEGIVRKEDRRFYLLGGKGGVGKTTSSAALAVHLATQNVPTLVVSTDPAHSLSDSFGQDISGGAPVALQGTDLPIWGMEIDPEEARQELRNLAREDGGNEVFDALKNFGLGGVGEQLKDLNLGELLDNPPPGIDEAVAISRVIRFLRNPDYAQFRCVVFDTAPTGHTLRLLSLPDFFNTGIGKLVRLRFTIANTVGKVTSFFSRDKGRGAAVDSAMDRLRELQGALDEARAMFHDKERTEFVVVTIPTVMAMAESERLVESLHTQEVPCKRMVVNQLVRCVPPDCNCPGMSGSDSHCCSCMRMPDAGCYGFAQYVISILQLQVNDDATDKFLNARRGDQQRALTRLRSDEKFKCLQVIEAPLLDLEVRGVPALQYFGSQVWQGDVLAPHEAAESSAASSSSATNGSHHSGDA